MLATADDLVILLFSEPLFVAAFRAVTFFAMAFFAVAFFAAVFYSDFLPDGFPHAARHDSAAAVRPPGRRQIS